MAKSARAASKTANKPAATKAAAKSQNTGEKPSNPDLDIDENPTEEGVGDDAATTTTAAAASQADSGAGDSADQQTDAKPAKESKAKGKALGKYKVKEGKSFRDINDFNNELKEGDDVSHFDQARLDNLVELGLVEKI